MHEYLMEIQQYFGTKRFQVTADSREEALEKSKDTIYYKDSNSIKESLRVVKKLKPSFG